MHRYPVDQRIHVHSSHSWGLRKSRQKNRFASTRVRDRRAHPAPVSNTPVLLPLLTLTHQRSTTAARVSERRLESGKSFKMTMTLAYWDIRGVSSAVFSAVANTTSFVGGCRRSSTSTPVQHRRCCRRTNSLYPLLNILKLNSGLIKSTVHFRVSRDSLGKVLCNCKTPACTCSKWYHCQ